VVRQGAGADVPVLPARHDEAARVHGGPGSDRLAREKRKRGGGGRVGDGHGSCAIRLAAPPASTSTSR
jgi:hypothetical protein